MANHPVSSVQLLLSNERGGGRLLVDLEPFIAFDIQMNHRLEQLVDRWHDVAAPRAARGGDLLHDAFRRPAG